MRTHRALPTTNASNSSCHAFAQESGHAIQLDQPELVTLGNPFGPFVRGFDDVAETMERAATYYRDGKAIGFDLVAKEVTQDLAFVVEVERVSSKIGDAREETPSHSG